MYSNKNTARKLPKQEYILLGIFFLLIINILLSLDNSSGMSVIVSDQSALDHKVLKANICLKAIKSLQRKEIDKALFNDEIFNTIKDNDYKNIEDISNFTPYVNIEGVSICRVVLDAPEEKRFLTFEMLSNSSFPFIYKIVSIKETSEGSL